MKGTNEQKPTKLTVRRMPQLGHKVLTLLIELIHTVLSVDPLKLRVIHLGVWIVLGIAQFRVILDAVVDPLD